MSEAVSATREEFKSSEDKGKAVDGERKKRGKSEVIYSKY
jgi:hypothetical protein